MPGRLLHAVPADLLPYAFLSARLETLIRDGKYYEEVYDTMLPYLVRMFPLPVVPGPTRPAGTVRDTDPIPTSVFDLNLNWLHCDCGRAHVPLLWKGRLHHELAPDSISWNTYADIQQSMPTFRLFFQQRLLDTLYTNSVLILEQQLSAWYVMSECLLHEIADLPLILEARSTFRSRITLLRTSEHYLLLRQIEIYQAVQAALRDRPFIFDTHGAYEWRDPLPLETCYPDRITLQHHRDLYTNQRVSPHLQANKHWWSHGVPGCCVMSTHVPTLRSAVPSEGDDDKGPAGVAHHQPQSDQAPTTSERMPTLHAPPVLRNFPLQYGPKGGVGAILNRKTNEHLFSTEPATAVISLSVSQLIERRVFDDGTLRLFYGDLLLPQAGRLFRFRTALVDPQMRLGFLCWGSMARHKEQESEVDFLSAWLHAFVHAPASVATSTSSDRNTSRFGTKLPDSLGHDRLFSRIGLSWNVEVGVHGGTYMHIEKTMEDDDETPPRPRALRTAHQLRATLSWETMTQDAATIPLLITSLEEYTGEPCSIRASTLALDQSPAKRIQARRVHLQQALNKTARAARRLVDRMVGVPAPLAGTVVAPTMGKIKAVRHRLLLWRLTVLIPLLAPMPTAVTDVGNILPVLISTSISRLSNRDVNFEPYALGQGSELPLHTQSGYDHMETQRLATSLEVAALLAHAVLDEPLCYLYNIPLGTEAVTSSDVHVPIAFIRTVEDLMLSRDLEPAGLYIVESDISHHSVPPGGRTLRLINVMTPVPPLQMFG